MESPQVNWIMRYGTIFTFLLFAIVFVTGDNDCVDEVDNDDIEERSKCVFRPVAGGDNDLPCEEGLRPDVVSTRGHAPNSGHSCKDIIIAYRCLPCYKLTIGAQTKNFTINAFSTTLVLSNKKQTRNSFISNNDDSNNYNNSNMAPSLMTWACDVKPNSQSTSFILVIKSLHLTKSAPVSGSQSFCSNLFITEQSGQGNDRQYDCDHDTKEHDGHVTFSDKVAITAQLASGGMAEISINSVKNEASFNLECRSVTAPSPATTLLKSTKRNTIITSPGEWILTTTQKPTVVKENDSGGVPLVVWILLGVIPLLVLLGMVLVLLRKRNYGRFTQSTSSASSPTQPQARPSDVFSNQMYAVVDGAMIKKAQPPPDTTTDSDALYTQVNTGLLTHGVTVNQKPKKEEEPYTTFSQDSAPGVGAGRCTDPYNCLETADGGYSHFEGPWAEPRVHANVYDG